MPVLEKIVISDFRNIQLQELKFLKLYVAEIRYYDFFEYWHIAFDILANIIIFQVKPQGFRRNIEAIFKIKTILWEFRQFFLNLRPVWSNCTPTSPEDKYKNQIKIWLKKSKMRMPRQ